MSAVAGFSGLPEESFELTSKLWVNNRLCKSDAAVLFAIVVYLPCHANKGHWFN